MFDFLCWQIGCLLNAANVNFSKPQRPELVAVIVPARSEVAQRSVQSRDLSAAGYAVASDLIWMDIVVAKVGGGHSVQEGRNSRLNQRCEQRVKSPVIEHCLTWRRELSAVVSTTGLNQSLKIAEAKWLFNEIRIGCSPLIVVAAEAGKRRCDHIVRVAVAGGGEEVQDTGLKIDQRNPKQWCSGQRTLRFGDLDAHLTMLNFHTFYSGADRLVSACCIIERGCFCHRLFLKVEALSGARLNDINYLFLDEVRAFFPAQLASFSKRQIDRP